MNRPKISKDKAEYILQCSHRGCTYIVIGRFVYKFRGGKIYRAENVGYWGRLWECVEVDE